MTHAWPASFAQRRIWFIAQLEPGAVLYNVPVALRLRGRLDPGAMERALTGVVDRHEALRTTFELVGAQPMQLVAPPSPVPLPLVDLEHLSAERREREAERLVEEETGTRFDLARGPLIRARLLRLGPEEHILVLVLHHIVSDGWSFGVLYRELSALYREACGGDPAGLAPLPVQYRHYAESQHKRLQGPALADALAYWREHLAGAPPLLTLPTDRPRPAVQSYRGARHRLLIEPEIAAGLVALGRATGATPFMTLIAAFGVLLGRYSGQGDVVVGSPIAGRTRTELEGLIGFFVNTLALRLSVGGKESFRTLLRRVREVALGAYGHQELPFERLVEELSPQRTLRHHPVFQVLFALQNTPRSPIALPGLTAEYVPLRLAEARFDLSLQVAETTDGLRAGLEYSTDLFDPATAARILQHYRALLAAIVADPDRDLARLPMFAPGERLRIVTEWGRGPETDPGEGCVHRLFEAQVARVPDRVAVETPRGRVTYAELDARAEQVSDALRGLGVARGEVVAIALDRSTDFIAAVLGVLKSGSAFLGLDRSQPAARRAAMLADASVRVVLTSRGAPPPPGSIATVYMDDLPAPREGLGAAPAAEVRPADLAYVIYTSGTTGRPKGVMVEHRGLANAAITQAACFGVGPGDRVLQLAAPAFDASVLEIAMSLAAGATLYLPAADDLLAGEDLRELLRGADINAAVVVPSVLATLPEGPLPALRTLGVAGEPCPPELVARWAPGRRFLNLYGPAEASVWSTWARCLPTAEGEPPPIGVPIAGVRAYVLDDALEPCATGVPGELFIGGIGVARGYLGRPGQTADRFLPDPFDGRPGARMYRTGDLARWRGTGALEFFGRRDTQVKVRGCRIEPGEIESLLAGHPAVQGSAVVARADGEGDTSLTAYVVPVPGSEVTEAELRDHLAAALPDYMVPSGILLLDRLPLTPNGKLDRTALPAAVPPKPPAEPVPPRTPTEEALVRIWSEVLRRERIGVHDNFFSLGGHSLLATQVVSRVRRAFNADLPVRALFETPTIAGLAARLPDPGGEAPGSAPPLVRVARAAYRVQPPQGSR